VAPATIPKLTNVTATYIRLCLVSMSCTYLFRVKFA
jgi:hypothetical protein